MARRRRIKAILEAEDRASATIGNVRTAVAGLGAIAAAVGVQQLGGKLVRGLEDVTRAAAEQEKQERKLQAALQATGQFSNEAFESLAKQASGLQQLTDVGDETILQVQALLIQFGVGTEQVTEFSESVLDLAKTFQIDYLSAATLVSKAVAGNVGALSRYGIAVDSAELKTRGAVAVLDELQRVMGGRARAEADTLSGSMTQLGNAVGDVKEAIGRPFAQVAKSTIQEVLVPLATQFTEGTEAAELYRKAVIRLALGFVELLIPLEKVAQSTGLQSFIANYGKASAQAVETVGTNLSNLGDRIGSFFDGLSNLRVPIGIGLGSFGGFLEGVEESRDLRERIEAESGELEETLSTLEKLRDSLQTALVSRIGEPGGGGEGSVQAAEELVRLTAQLEAVAARLGPELTGLFGGIEQSIESANAALASSTLTDLSAFGLSLGEEQLEQARRAEETLRQIRLESDEISGEERLELEQERIAAAFDAEIRANEENAIAIAQLEEAKQLALTQAARKGVKEREKLIKLEKDAQIQAGLQIASASVDLLETLFGKSKATAIAKAIINTAEAVTVALKAADPPFSYALAALTAAKGLAEISKIKGTQIQGAQTGGILQGLDRGFDSAIFAGRPGEAVLPRELTDLLLEAATRGAGTGEPLEIVLQSDVPLLVDRVNAEVRQGTVRVVATDLQTRRRVR